MSPALHLQDVSIEVFAKPGAAVAPSRNRTMDTLNGQKGKDFVFARDALIEDVFQAAEQLGESVKPPCRRYWSRIQITSQRYRSPGHLSKIYRLLLQRPLH